MEAFSSLLGLCEGNSPVDSPHKDHWRGALMFFFISPWRNGWANNRDADDLRRHRTHYDVTVMRGFGLYQFLNVPTPGILTVFVWPYVATCPATANQYNIYNIYSTPRKHKWNGCLLNLRSNTCWINARMLKTRGIIKIIKCDADCEMDTLARSYPVCIRNKPFT